MAISLGPAGGILRYGTYGPDKWTFIHEGILDRKPDGTDHEFFIDGRKVNIVITAGRRIYDWECPSHPNVDPSRHYYAWTDAWEFSGCGAGCHIEGIYSPRSRKGVFHFWPIHIAEDGCLDARRDLQQFFIARNNSEALLALTRAMTHMARGTAVGGHHVDCQSCWEVFQKFRQARDVR
jgi:hypothetical protein